MSIDDLSTRARSENPYYIATLAQPDTGLRFRGWVPESFSINFRSNWEPIFGSLNDVSSALTKGAQGIGVVPNLKQATRQVWVGSDPIELQFIFLLDAYKDAYQDVQVPIETLLQMTTPKRSGAFLSSPGPTFLSDTNRIYLRIGKFFVLDSVVITDVDVTYHTISDINGQYQAADVSVAMKSHYTPDQQDILSYFANGRSNVDGLINSSPLQSAANVGSAIFSAFTQAGISAAQAGFPLN